MRSRSSNVCSPYRCTLLDATLAFPNSSSNLFVVRSLGLSMCLISEPLLAKFLSPLPFLIKSSRSRRTSIKSLHINSRTLISLLFSALKTAVNCDSTRFQSVNESRTSRKAGAFLKNSSFKRSQPDVEPGSRSSSQW